jgi:cytochrome c553
MSRILAALLLIVGVSGHALAAGSAEAGQSKSATCAACHGPDGNSVNPEWPSIAGQHESYLKAQLTAFREGKRQNALMSPQAMNLSDEDIADLAAYYTEQTAKGGTADPELAGIGERLYRGGDPSNSVSACIACHGPSGRGNPAAIYPSIQGQHATYTAAQLRAYAAGERRSDMNQMMRNIAAAMSAEQIVAVAAYIEGLRDDTPSGYKAP